MMRSKVPATACLLLIVLFLFSPPGRGTDDPASGPIVDFVAVNADVTKLLFFFAEYGGLNIIVDGSVSGKMTLRLTRVDPATAFAVVLELAELEAYEVDGSLFITKKIR